ncbi:hypothetical protein CANINC_004188 [Pichia inconspicua]|uniref:THUMP domain-containing protein n=1 Tax=Pichia inconspicua TaxID=52247 RepID=A0A4T0WWV8_9ASCO|nr:hypothetical protein CANINC_004188 [[Candida] inconspicua]
MGKRKGYPGTGSNSKRQRSHALVEPGMYGVYATCPKFKEVAAAKEMRVILQEAIEKYYPKAEDDCSDAEAEDVNDEITNTVDIEDEIAKEIAEIKKNDDKAKSNRNNKELVMREIPLGVESLTFFKLRKPIIPSVLVSKICHDIKESGRKHGRFVQKITPIDKSCNATDVEFKKLLSATVEQYVSENDDSIFTTYNVNLVKRNFDTISRDEFMEMIQEEMDTRFGKDNAQLRYKGATTLINIYCFKNSIGASCVPQNEYTELSKYNLQQLFIAQAPKESESRVDTKENAIRDVVHPKEEEQQEVQETLNE